MQVKTIFKDTDELAIVVKGYPRLSETFIVQEILTLQNAGIKITIISLRHPTDRKQHPINKKIMAELLYLPEYLFVEPLRVIRSWMKVRSQDGYKKALKTWLKDLFRDPTPNRIRRWGQALVLSAELSPSIKHLYAHFLHTPASVTYYAALLTGRSWSVSAHAKDIWLTPHWEKSEKLLACKWAVTCSSYGFDHLNSIVYGKTQLSYHGLDLASLPGPPPTRVLNTGTKTDNPIKLLSVGRAVPKKGFDILLDALSKLPSNLNWIWTHVGGGQELKKLKKLAHDLGIEKKIIWRGACDQSEVFEEYQRAEIFILPSVIAKDGDRDGLPNVLMEAASQELCCVASDVAALSEFIIHGETGLLVPPNNPDALVQAIIKLSFDYNLRIEMGSDNYKRLQKDFCHITEVNKIIDNLGNSKEDVTNKLVEP